jgi:hypothetical protein
VGLIDDPLDPEPGESADHAVALRQAIHRVNNYLAAVGAYVETALAKNDPAFDRRVLETMLARSRELEEQLREIRRQAGV